MGIQPEVGGKTLNIYYSFDIYRKYKGILGKFSIFNLFKLTRCRDHNP